MAADKQDQDPRHATHPPGVVCLLCAGPVAISSVLPMGASNVACSETRPASQAGPVRLQPGLRSARSAAVAAQKQSGVRVRPYGNQQPHVAAIAFCLRRPPPSTRPPSSVHRRVQLSNVGGRGPTFGKPVVFLSSPPSPSRSADPLQFRIQNSLPLSC